MKIYTKTGDKGKTSLFGGERVDKFDLRIESYGTVDELNSILGVAVGEIKDQEVLKVLYTIQNQLFTVVADLATPEQKNKKKFQIKRLNTESVKFLEDQIDYFDEKLAELKQFILPGGTKGAAFLHQARTVSRRAERKIVLLKKISDINEIIVVYLNRLSDLLFVLARTENQYNKFSDTKWNSEVT